MNKKVLILNPYACKNYYSDITVQWKKRTNLLHPPIFLAYIAAFLRSNGINIAFLDAAGENLDFRKNLKRIIKIKPDLIITKTHFSTWNWEKSLFVAIKEKLRLPVVSVGIHPTLVPEEFLKESTFDIAVRKEPELTCLDIAKGLELKEIKGISYRDDGTIVRNPDRELIENLDILPFPARDLFPHKNYRLSSYKRKPMTVIFTGRGCHFNCIHCGQQVVWGHRRRVRSAKNVIKEIEEIHKLGYKEISFEDQIVECDERMIEIAKGIKKYNFSWKFGTRADLINEEALKIFKKAGCYEVFLGVESGDEKCLGWLNKGINLKQIEEAFKMCRKNKLFINATFMIGLPRENRESVIKTIELAKKLNPDYATFYAFTPIPGTLAFDFYKSNSLLTKENWNSIDFQKVCVKTKYLSSKEIEELINEAYKQFYFRISYIFKMLKKINSFSIIGAICSLWRLIISLFKRENLNNRVKEIKEKILEEAKKEYKFSEIFEDKRIALKKTKTYRQNGFYFAIPIKENNGWRIFIE
ncbi:MAG: hypothetical protein AMJ95_01185 [Omnitrophica WOR_2 bacterium SM23_72]|nr:MAG: hypothetical protein AMJ95_01185 [Omnitrophica WOR_2 bacterium SM23_72]